MAFKARRITNASRGTANARHFYYALVFGDYGVMRKVGSSVGCPLSGRYVFSGKFSQLCAYNSDVRCTMSENQKVKRAEPIETCSYK
ncbi:hypothetical protein ACVYFC_17930, partial [Vibrio cholerae]